MWTSQVYGHHDKMARTKPLNMPTGHILYDRASSWSRHLSVSYASNCLVISIVLPLEYQLLSNPCLSVWYEFSNNLRNQINST